MTLRRFDLNLLRVFDALMTHRHATRAGEHLGLTQSAVSNALARLRDALDDDLFVRVGNEMRPTARARDMAPTVRDVLREVGGLLEPVAFDPAHADKVFALEIGEYQCATLFPKLIAVVGREAPGVRLFARHLRYFSAGSPILLGEDTDFAIGAWSDIPSRYRSLDLGYDHFVIVLREEHPLAAIEIDLETYCAARHLDETPSALRTASLVDDSLAAMKRSRNVHVRTNYFSSCPEILLNTDLILTTSTRLAGHYCKDRALVSRPLPWQLATTPLVLLWHVANDRSPAHIWLRKKIAELSQHQGTG